MRWSDVLGLCTLSLVVSAACEIAEPRNDGAVLMDSGAMTAVDSGPAARDVGPTHRDSGSSSPSDSGSSPRDGGAPLTRVPERVYEVTDVDSTLFRSIHSLTIAGDRLFWHESGYSSDDTWGIWTCVTLDCASPERLSDPVVISMTHDASHLYFADWPDGGPHARIARCPLGSLDQCRTPEVLAARWGDSVFTDVYSVSGATYLTDDLGIIYRCATQTNCESTTQILSGGSYGDLIVGDSERIHFSVYTSRIETPEVPETFLGSCLTSACEASVGALTLDEAPSWVGDLALRDTTLYFVDEQYEGETHRSRLFSCDVSTGIDSCTTTGRLLGSFDRGPMTADPVRLAVDATDVYLLAVHAAVDADHMMLLRCPRTGCNASGPEILVDVRTALSTPYLALTDEYAYWAMWPIETSDREGIYRVPLR